MDDTTVPQDPAPTTLDPVVVTGKTDKAPMMEISKQILTTTLDKIEAYGNDPSQIERDLAGGGLLGGIAGAYLKSMAEKPGFKSNSFTMLAEMLPLLPKVMQNNPYQKEFPELAKQGKEVFESTGLTQGDFDQMAAQVRARADGALREWGEKIIVGFGTTSPDPYIAHRQENTLREQANEAGETGKALDEAAAQAKEAAGKVDKRWAKDGVAVEHRESGETGQMPAPTGPATPVKETQTAR